MSNAAAQHFYTQPPKGPQPYPGDDDPVAVIPGWIKDWGFVPLGVAALATLVSITRIGQLYGSGFGWALLVIATCGTLAVWRQDYGRRLGAARARAEQALYERLEIAKADAMTWQEFEEYCAKLLRTLGYRDVLVVGNSEDDDGADIIATAPDGSLVAVQCKHWKNSVGRGVIREVIGTITSGTHEGRAGIVMTNANATRGAHARAQAQQITIVDRPVLQQWISHARTVIEQRGHAPGTLAPTQPGSIRPTVQAAAGLSAGFLLLIVIALQHSTPHHAHTRAAPIPRPAPTATYSPSALVEAAFTAINRHDWPTLWRLWGHQTPARGPAYRKMIAGYRLTARDVITSIHSRGDTVSAHVRAYETTGTVQTYQFRYRVHAGKFTWGHSVLLGTGHYRREAPAVPAQPSALSQPARARDVGSLAPVTTTAHRP
jgi:restriction system protein